jgi:hypothetical protein
LRQRLLNQQRRDTILAESSLQFLELGDLQAKAFTLGLRFLAPEALVPSGQAPSCWAWPTL